MGVIEVLRDIGNLSVDERKSLNIHLYVDYEKHIRNWLDNNFMQNVEVRDLSNEFCKELSREDKLLYVGKEIIICYNNLDSIKLYNIAKRLNNHVGYRNINGEQYSIPKISDKYKNIVVVCILCVLALIVGTFTDIDVIPILAGLITSAIGLYKENRIVTLAGAIVLFGTALFYTM